MKKSRNPVWLSACRILAALAIAGAVASAALPEWAAGLELIGNRNCTACHAATERQTAWLEPKAAPRLAEIGSRARGAWLQRFLTAPQDAKPGTTMPDVLHGNAAQAEALTHFLLAPSKADVRPIFPDKAAVARGENLYHSVGCVACHAPLNGAAVPADAVPLPQMAEKWTLDGLRRFLLDPLAVRPGGRMPSLNLTDGEAADLAHYLLRATRVAAPAEVAFFRGRIRSLESLDTAELARTAPATGLALEGRMRDRGTALRLTAWLEVTQPGDYTFFLTATGASRLWIGGAWVLGAESWEAERVNEKYPLQLAAGRHELKVDYVQRGAKEPALAVEWEGPGTARTLIPGSRLSIEREPAAEQPALVVDLAKAEQGRALYGALHCAACHEAKPLARPPPALAALQPARGCLAEKPAATVPDFHFDATQREAVRTALTALYNADLAAPTPQQRVAQTMSAFRCTACHMRDGRGGVTADRGAFFTANVDDLGDEGRLPPKLDGVGDKLRPEWLKKVLDEGAPVRPYLNTRMPKFGAANVGHLADLFVALDRQAVPVAAVNDPPEVQREAGRKLTGTDGLSCIACHRFARQPAHALQVLDLATTTERLNEDWFRRFLRDPEHFNVGTRMPALWPSGRSLLTAVLDGDTDRQHAALWTYFGDGPKAKFPEGLSRQNMELVVGGEAVGYRGKLWEAGFRGIATGFPGGVNASFDAEEMRLAVIWRGRFLNVSPHWSVQGMGKIRPLGTDEIVFPHGPPFAVLATAATPWPTETSKALGMKFSGYQLDAWKRPTFLYAFGQMAVEDFLAPSTAGGKTGLHRTLKWRAVPPAGMHFRVATGKLTAAGEHAWRLNDVLTIAVEGAFVRGQGGQQELLVPLRFDGANPPLEVDYVW